MNELLHVDIFSGIGGFSLAFEAVGFETVCFCENDPDRQRDLRHHWSHVPIVGDISDTDAICRVVADTQESRRRQPQPGPRPQERAITGRSGRATLVLTAGVPCQPASAAGKRKASADDRWLWPQTIQLVDRLRPDYLVFENPVGIASLAEPAAIPGVDLERLRSVPGRTLCEILTAIRLRGYEFPTDRDGHPWIPCVPAAGVGAFHERTRLWIVARCRTVGNTPTSRRTGSNGSSEQEQGPGQGRTESRGVVGNTEIGTFRTGLRETEEPHGHSRIGIGRYGDSSGKALPDWSDAVLQQGHDQTWRAVKPGLHLLASRVPRRVAKLRGFGNSICPQVAFQIAKTIRETITQ